MPHFDVVVLGAGPGGYVAAIRAAQLGKSVAVVEEKYWGGVCLNVGCIPSKALLRNAELAHLMTTEKETFGITGEVSFDYGAAFDRSRVVADGRVKGVHFLMKKNKITEFDGWATFTDPNSLHVALSQGGFENITFDNAILATGASTKLLPGTSLSERVVTYEEQILTRELPRSVIIAGAGAIGVEFAYVLSNYGVKVTIVEFLERMLPPGGRGGLQGTRQAVSEARRRRADLHEGRADRRLGGDRHRHGLGRTGPPRPAGGQSSAGDRVPAAGRGLWSREAGRRTDRARRHRGRRLHADQRPTRLCDR
jgi:glycine/D-amino acid oxidase-like deaminating enzyme